MTVICSDTNMLDHGQMSVQVYASHSLGEDYVVAESNAPFDVSSLFKGDNSELNLSCCKIVTLTLYIAIDMEIQRSLFKTDKNGQIHQAEGSIHITLLRTGSASIPLDQLVDGAGNSVSAMQEPRKSSKVAGAILYRTSTGVKKILGTYDIWKPLSLKIEAFVRIMDGVSEVSIPERCAKHHIPDPLVI
jgi:hypothetical protein